MASADDTVPTRPRQPTAPGTHPAELQRLALQEQTHPDCQPLAVQAKMWLFRAANAAFNAQADELRGLGVSPSAFNVLMALRHTPGHVLEPCQLAERLLISRPSITGLLDNLQAKGLVARRPHDRDGRRVVVVLTSGGQALLQEHFPTHYAELHALVESLTDEEQATLVTLLRRVRGATPAHLAGD